MRTVEASLSSMSSLRFSTRYPNGTVPPIHMPFFREARNLSLMRSPITSRSNCAKESRMLSVSLPIEVVVLKLCVTETKVT
jgi:hypothetical protein